MKLSNISHRIEINEVSKFMGVRRNYSEILMALKVTYLDYSSTL
jgi:hypothetical protein